MKIRLFLKDSDGVYDSINDAIEKSLEGVDGLSKSERESLMSDRREALDLSEWVQWGQYVTVEIDTDAGTARVGPASEEAAR